MREAFTMNFNVAIDSLDFTSRKFILVTVYSFLRDKNTFNARIDHNLILSKLISPRASTTLILYAQNGYKGPPKNRDINMVTSDAHNLLLVHPGTWPSDAQKTNGRPFIIRFS